jgi:hypothetical protein
MKTYKIEQSKAVSLRKQLLWANILAFFTILIAAFFVGVGTGTSSAGALGMAAVFGVAAVVTGIISIVAYWRALWALWEWPGIAIGLAVAVGIFVLNALTGGLVGNIASIAFLVYVYVQLGKQAGVPVAAREVFEE